MASNKFCCGSLLILLPFFVNFAQGSEIVISASKSETVIYSHAKDACEPWDIPDAPTRLFRDKEGEIHLIISHVNNREMVGHNFGGLVHNCKILFKGNESKIPSDFSDRAWISSTYTLDGIVVEGLIHNEYQAYRWPDVCPLGDYKKCWYNTITAVVSRDAGRSYQYASPKLVAAINAKAKEVEGGQAGVFSPSNIIKKDNFYYFFATVVDPINKISGNCLFRTSEINDPASWRSWISGSFSGKISDPYLDGGNGRGPVCDIIGQGKLSGSVSSVVYHEPSKSWIAVMTGERLDKKGTKLSGIFYSFSKDLLSWSYSRQLTDAPLINSPSCLGQSGQAYPVILDPKSQDRNFQSISDDALLVYVRLTPTDCKYEVNRDLVSVFIKINQMPRE